MSMRSVIYRLKQTHGRACTYISIGQVVVDPETGIQDAIKTTYQLRPIVVPVRLLLSYVGTMRTAKHPSGAFYNDQTTVALFDRSELPKGFKISEGDELIMLPQRPRLGVADNQSEPEKFAVKAVLDLHGEYFVEAGLVRIAFDIEGETKI